MQLQTLLSVVCLLFLALPTNAQNIRNYDGTGNNIDNYEWGAAHSQMTRLTPAVYADGIGAVGGNDRPNPRAVSNAVFAQEDLFDDPRNMSDYCWVWGQFIDHDLVLTEDSPEFIYVQVPAGDPLFDPWNTGAALIPLRRSQAVAGSGTDVNNPLEYANALTAFIDGSAVYGSDEARADWLRTHQDGKMKTSAGNLLPYNTYTGEIDAPVDPNAPFMDDATGQLDKLFVAGDLRANENVLLLAMHTLLVREHNYQCDVIKLQHPAWGDELVFQHARRKVGGLIAAITYEQWLPAMGVHLDPYYGYNANVNPAITNDFSAAAFRMGHTLLSGSIKRMDMDGNTIPEGDLELKDAFFQTEIINEGGGLGCLFKGMATQPQQMMDGKVVDAVRNFLFGPAGAGGLDLVSINIARGRERGVADFNTIRAALGLEPYEDFEDMTNDAELANILGTELGYNVSNLDAWVGMLTEKHMPDALFGETVMEIMKLQFESLRAGDRFYYENDPLLSDAEKDEIKNTMLRDLVMRNTDIPVMQHDLFFAMPHEMLCAATAAAADISGTLLSLEGESVADVEVNISATDDSFATEIMSNETGFSLAEAPTCAVYEITPGKNINHKNGVTTADLVKIRRHILDIEPFESPYKIIAADANNSGSIATSDLVEIRKLILNVSEEFANNTSWRFVDAAYAFPNAENPWEEDFPESVVTANLQDNLADVNFVAVKIGDVNDSVNPNNLQDEGEERDDAEPFVFSINDEMLTAGARHTVRFTASDIADVAGFQFTLNYDTEYLEFVQLSGGALPDFGVQSFYVMPAAGAVTLSWNSDKDFDPTAELFNVTFKAKKGVKKICEVLTLNSRYTRAEAYTRDGGDIKDMAVLFNCMNGPMLVHNKFELYQNIPNPVAERTEIGFYLPAAGEARLTVTDASGRVLYTKNGDFAKGMNTVNLERSELNAAAGTVFYSVESAAGKAGKGMILR